MIDIRKSDERGRTRFEWLDSRHSFSFAEYMDPRAMGFRSLRVLNEDVIAPGAGFPTHPHRDMEILTWVLAGGLAHKDSMGHHAVLRAGELQRMTAGSGVTHSEFNDSQEEAVHLLQIWIVPEHRGLRPGYEQRSFELGPALRCLASPDGRDASLSIHQDVAVYGARLAAGDEARHALGPERHAWVQVATGAVAVNGAALAAGDAAAVSGEEHIDLRASDAAEILLFDLA